jgi:hypothetical protein
MHEGGVLGRGHVELVHAADLESEEVPADGWPVGATVTVLSSDRETGELTGILRLPRGYRRGAGHHAAATETFVLSGTLRVGEEVRGYGFYEFAAPGVGVGPWAVAEGCELFFRARGRPDFAGSSGEAGELVQIDSESMPWVATHIPGPPPGIILKLLRHVEETGEMTWLCGNPPRWDYPRLEFHDCIEELYCIEGDIWLGNSGTMRPRSYLWRPPFITHGPFYSRTGCLLFGWVPSTLVNHLPASALSTPEENEAAFERDRDGGS